jgi:hypothetical protein
MRRTYLYVGMTEDAVQRRRWTFYEAVTEDHEVFPRFLQQEAGSLFHGVQLN